MRSAGAITSYLICLALGFGLIACSGQQGHVEEEKAAPVPMGFDSGGNKVFNAYDEIPISKMAADSGDRTLNVYYSRRQYPGSPPTIPHKIERDFSGKAENCLSCHEKGGHDPELGKSVPVTPHPEYESCRQCHVPANDIQPFAEHDWLSVRKPRLGQSMLAGSPPPIPHSLQMRDNCIACHTGEGSVVELRVEHPARGNCRQCHVPFIQSDPTRLFERKS